MSNYNLVIDTSNFKPFDINPALQVLHDYRDAYYRLEDQMNKIAEEKGQYVLPDTPENQEYRGVMDRYNTDYNAVVEDFSKGMNLENARRIKELRKRYSSEVAPINRAIEAYNKDQDKMTALGPDAIIGNRNRTIRDYYGGVAPGLNYRSGKGIQQTAAGIMQGIDNALMSAPAQAGNIAKQYFILKQQGINGQDALNEILKHNPQLNSTQGAADAGQLISALDRVYQQYAFDEGTPENSKIWENVVTGAIQGIQAPKYSMQANHGYLNPAQQYALTQQKAEDKFKYKYDDTTGAITGWNDDYLKGAYTGKRGAQTSDEYEEQPDGGTFHPTAANKKEEHIASASEVSRSTVPGHISAEYPDGTKFYVCKDAAGNVIGYKAIKYKRVKKVATSSEEQTTEQGGQESDFE